MTGMPTKASLTGASVTQGGFKTALDQLIDALNERVVTATTGAFSGVGSGVGITTAPNATFHVHTATAGPVSVNAAADDLVVENSSTGGISILVPNTSGANLFFGDEDDNDVGGITYGHISDSMQFTVNAAERVRIGSTGTLYVGDTSNGNMQVGLTIDMGANDDQAVAVKSSDVSTGLTTLTQQNVEDDDYFTISKATNTAGGLLIQSMAEDTTGFSPLQIRSYGGTAGVTDTTSSVGMIDLYVTEHNGSNGFVDVAAGGNVFTVRCRDGGADVTRLLLKKTGELHLGNTTLVTLADDKDDCLMLRAFDHLKAAQGAKGLIRSKWDAFVRYNYDDLVEAGIIGRVTPEERAEGVQGLWNVTQHIQLLNGAMWQLYGHLRDTQERLATAELRLAALPAN